MAFQRKKSESIGVKAPLPGFVEPALASSIAKVPSGARWIHEIKFDGYRVQGRLANEAVTIFTRRGHDWTHRFKKVSHDAWHIKAASAVIDGEIVVPAADGTTDFSVLQNELKGQSTKIVMVAFDLLYLNGRDLRKLPLHQRKSELKKIIAGTDIQFSESFEIDGGRDAGVRLSRDAGERRLEDLFENAPCGYLTLAPDGRISRVNQTLSDWTGYSREHFAGKRLHQFLNMAGRIYFETHIAPLLRMQGFFHEFALDFVTETGDRMPVIANAAEQRSPDGDVLSTRLVIIRAADRRRYERELVEARTTATESLKGERETSELREQFIAVLGHDLRNPLAAISAGARILQRSGALVEQRELRVIDMINTTVTRMSDLIDHVLDFARGRLGGGITLSRDSRRPLEPVLEQVVDELRTASPGRVIETSFEITEPVNCDRTRVGQLVSNLIGNALTHGSPDEPVRVGAKTEGGVFELWVSNAGEPIPDAAMEKLFEPFFRGDVRDSRQGLGLGLHIASQIAQAHGGSIVVASTAEETRFVFRLPLRG